MKKNINFTGLFLFLIYVFGNSPAIMFHHHDNAAVTYNKEDKCEIAIFGLDKENACEHKQHISKTFKKCSLCDNHTLAVHTNFTLVFKYPIRLISHEYNPYTFSFQSVTRLLPTNRGPPTV